MSVKDRVAKASDESGQSSIEVALMLILLLPVVFGMTTFGLAMNNYLSLTEATSVGARQFAIGRGQGGDPCAVAASTISAAAPQLKNTGPVTGISYTFTVGGSTYNSNPATCQSATLSQGQPVTVSTSYPCALTVFGVNYVSSCFLNAQTVEVIQ